MNDFPLLADDGSEEGSQDLAPDLSDEDIEEIADILFSGSQDEDPEEIELSPEPATDQDPEG